VSQQKRQRAIRLFVVVLALTALANGLGNNILSNYFNEVFHVDEVQRGFIEIPRESPGILCMVLVAALGFLGNLWMSVVAQALVLVGFLVMGWMSPGYGMMLAFMFIHSLGMHLFMPLNDAISMDLAERGKVGSTLGKFKGVTTLFSMAAAVMVFFGFRTGFFSFQTGIILPFAIGGAATAGAVALLALMALSVPRQDGVKNHRLLFTIWSLWPTAVKSGSRSCLPPGSSSICWGRGRIPWPCSPLSPTWQVLGRLPILEKCWTDGGCGGCCWRRPLTSSSPSR